MLPQGVYDDDSSGTYLARRAVEFLEEHKTGRFCLWVGFHEPHSPFDFPIEDQGRVDPKKVTVPEKGPEDARWIPQIFGNLTEQDQRGIIASYYTAVEYLDKNVGLLLDALDRLGLAESTLVIYAGDQGYLLGHHGRFEKHTMWEPAVRIPLIMRGASPLRRGQEVRGLVQMLDLAPTILDLLKIPSMPSLQGKSLIPLLQGQTDRIHEEIFSEYLPDNMAMLRTERWKFVFSSGQHELALGYQTGGPPLGREQRLYDEQHDPQEFLNLASDGRYAAVTSDLRERMLQVFLKTDPRAPNLPQDLSLERKLEWFLLPPEEKQGRYDATWESLDQRPVAPWWRDAKFGVYLHWTLASVPSWGTHSSFYWPNLLKSKREEQAGPKPRRNELADEHLGLWQFHLQNYGPDVQYEDFAPLFRAELFDPERWADLFVRSGARYVVLTAKHHDGFCLWPSAEASRSWGRPWNASEVGPKRDLVGELTTAVRKRGLPMGLYYSFFEWFNPLWLKDRTRYVAEHMQPQFRDLVTRYQPNILWADGEWDGPDALWQSRPFLAWLFNESTDRSVVINDRWGQGSRHQHGGFYTTEFTPGMADGQHPWEENRTITRPRAYDAEGRPLWYEWVYDRQLTLSNYYSARELVLTLADTVSRGGNLILNVSPTGDGRIPVIDEERLTQMGDWLRVNGEAIYGTQPWQHSCQWSPGEQPTLRFNQEWRVDYDIASLTAQPAGKRAAIEAFFTTNGETLYAILPWWPSAKLVLRSIPASAQSVATMLGISEPLRWQKIGPDLVLDIPKPTVDQWPCPYAYVVKVTHVGATAAQ
jgi:alpha-L-fucosidase